MSKKGNVCYYYAPEHKASTRLARLARLHAWSHPTEVMTNPTLENSGTIAEIAFLEKKEKKKRGSLSPLTPSAFVQLTS